MKRWTPLLFTAGLFIIDQLIKNWALKALKPVEQIIIIPGLFNLTYVENRGAAFGIFQGKTTALSIISGVLLLVIILALLLGKVRSRFLVWSVSVGLAGGLGNLYDRIFRGFVVDYLDFSALFRFPVFNFADCLVVVVTFFILYYCLRSESASGSQNFKAGDKTGHE